MKDGLQMKNARSYVGILLAIMMIGSAVLVPLSGALLGRTGSRLSSADVTVTSLVKFYPGFPKVGDNVTLNATIKNVGDWNATNVTITAIANTTSGSPMNLGTFYLGHDRGKPNLTGKPTSPAYYLEFFWNTSKTGLEVVNGSVYRVTVTASNATDLNASNNTAFVEFTFKPADKKWPYVHDIVVEPSSVTIGSNVTINATFMDNGSLPAPAEPVFFYVDYVPGGTNTDFFNTTVDILDYFDLGNTSLAFEYNTSGLSIGNHTVTVFVPSTGSNMTSANFTVKAVPPPPGKPDLTILELGVTSTSILKGLPLNLSITVKNVGNNVSVATKINVSDTFGLYSTNVSIPAMAAGLESVYHAIIDTAQLSVGSHSLQVWVDRPDLNDEWNETNNTKYIQVFVTSKPDLALSEMRFYENETWEPLLDAAQGTFVKITVHVKNLGQNSSLNGTLLTFYLDNTSSPINSMRPYSSGAGQTSCSPTNGSISLMPYAPGADYQPICIWNTSKVSVGVHKIIVIVDPDNRNVELNESNNRIEGNFTVNAIVYPSDLTLDSMQISSKNITAGDKVTISLVVANKGKGPAQNIDLDANLETTSGQYLKTINHTVLPYMGGNSQQYVNLIWQFAENMQYGTYMVQVILDPNNKIKETNENNNHNETFVKIIEKITYKSDPMITSIDTLPVKPKEDQKVTVTVNLVNTGNKDSRDLSVTLFLDGKKVGQQSLSVLAKGGTTGKMVFNITFTKGGKHWINATLYEGGAQVYTAQPKEVTVKTTASNAFTSTNTILLVLALLLLVAIAVVLLTAGKKKPSEYEDQKEEEEEKVAPAKTEEE
jgi:subtilase family serine protease